MIGKRNIHSEKPKYRMLVVNVLCCLLCAVMLSINILRRTTLFALLHTDIARFKKHNNLVTVVALDLAPHSILMLRLKKRN
jgi:hypothetical protein